MSRRQGRHVRFDGARVLAERQARNLTNEDLAREVGVTLRTVQRWQLGESAPAGIQAIALARVLELDVEDLYIEDGAAA